MKRLCFLFAILALAFLAWLFWPKAGQTIPNPPPPTSLSARQSKPEISPAASAERNTLADTLNSPDTDIAADLHLVSALLETFRTNFPHNRNPVGENTEITAALTGRNSLHLALIPPGHPAINARGELCDRWGTAFFFHQLSGTQMEIRSAGPDRKLWNVDDAVLSP